MIVFQNIVDYSYPCLESPNHKKYSDEIVDLELIEKQNPALQINLFIKDEEMGKILCENWKSKSTKIFDFILNELL